MFTGHLTVFKGRRCRRDDRNRPWYPHQNLFGRREIWVSTLFYIHVTACPLMGKRSHILAPTASDLVKYGKKDTILAGFHTDLNFLTIHGRSRYPGLNIWARNTGKRIPVKLPATGSYLLVQAGKQLEHITGGLVKAGFHEVVVNDATLKVLLMPCVDTGILHGLTSRQTIEARKAQFPDRPLIRISSTFFWHLSADYDLTPIPELAAKAHTKRADAINLGKTDAEEEVIYETLKVGQQVQKYVFPQGIFGSVASMLISVPSELRHIALMA